MASKGLKSPALALVLVVLAAALAPSAAAEDWVYRVKPGDNLWNLSDKYLTSMRFMDRLQSRNQIADPKRIPPGTRLRVPMQWLKLAPVPVTVVSAGGDTSATDSLGDPVALTPGLALRIGSRIKTGEDGNVVLEFADRSRLILRGGSDLVLDSMSAYGPSGMVDSRMRLEAGRLGATVTKAVGPGSRFEITTPAAVAAVRGTVERIAADGEGMRAEVTEGTVAVSGSGATSVVPEGFGTKAQVGQPPEPPRPLLPAPDLSGIAPLLERLPPALSWPAVEGAAAYRVQVASDASFETLLTDQLIDLPRLRGVDLADGDYFLRTRAIDPDRIEGLDATLAFTLNARPEPPFAQAPAHGSTVRDNFAPFQWAAPVNAVSYRFQLATDEAFENVIVTVDEVTDATVEVSATPTFGDYAWRVATRDATGEVGPYGDPQPFKLKPTPKQPSTEPPEIGETELAFRWSAGEPEQTYHFQLARDEAFTDLAIDERPADPTIVLQRPDPGDYHMRVATVDTDGYEGPFSTPQRIEVPPDGYWHYIIPGAAILLFIVL